MRSNARRPVGWFVSICKKVIKKLIKFIGMTFRLFIIVWFAFLILPFVALGLWYFGSSLQVALPQQETAKITSDGSIEQLLADATTLLSNDESMVARQSGILSLYRLAQNDKDSILKIHKLLSFHIRENNEGSNNEKITDDIQLALNMLTVREDYNDRATNPFVNIPLDLKDAYMRGADLSEARLQGAVLYNAHLQEARLFGAQLQGAYLIGAQLQGADLSGAQLQGAYDVALSPAADGEFAEKIRNRANQETALSTIILAGGMENADETEERMTDYRKEGWLDKGTYTRILKTIGEHSDKPKVTAKDYKEQLQKEFKEERTDTDLTDEMARRLGFTAGSYTEAEAEDWIRKQRRKMKRVRFWYDR